MYKDTNTFFDEIVSGNLASIDIKNHIKLITDNHKLEHLKTLGHDLSFYIFMLRGELDGNITKEDWDKKFEYYNSKGETMPKERYENSMRKLKKQRGLPYEDEPEFNEYYDKEKIFYPYDLFTIKQVEFYIKKLIKDDENPQSVKPIKPNKSLLFEGSSLNLSERFKIANKVLNIDKTIRMLNIKELEKYQLLAYILGCDKDNARNLMNGSYNSKDRDLSNYFNDLGLKE
ncbi:hypothetical protein [Flavobacterium microcysteis]